ncbi:MAG: MFS transporter, partial [Actinomycetota bacterium]
MAKRPAPTLDPSAPLRRALVPTPRLSHDGEEAQNTAEFIVPSEERVPHRPLRALAGWLQAANPRGISGPVLPLVIAALLGFLVQWEFTGTPSLLLEMRADFGFDLSFIATMAAVMSTVTLIFSPVMGYIADRVSRVWLLRAGALLGSAAVFATLTAHSLAVLLPARMAFSVAVVLTGGATLFPLLADWFPSVSRARVFAFAAAAAQMGTMLGPLIAGPLAGALGWRVAMIPFAGIWLLTGLLAFALRDPPRGYMDRLEMGAADDAARREQKPIGWSESWRAARSIVTLRRIWYAMPFIYIGTGGALAFMIAFFADIFHVGPTGRGLLYAGAGVSSITAVVILSPAIDRLLQRRPARVMTLAGLLPFAQAVLFTGLAFSPFLGLSAAIAIAITTFGVILGAGGFALMTLVTPARVRGLGIQTSQLWQVPGILVYPFVFSWAETLGLRRGMLVFIPMLVIAGVIVTSAAGGVAHDIRAARAAAMADEEAERARREDRERMLLVRDVDVTYDGTQVLFGVDLDLGTGEIVALLGTNGAGKSTLLRAIIGLQEASNGAIFFDGQDITHAPPHLNARAGIVMVPGGQAVFPTLSVMENLATARRALDLDDDVAKGRIAEVLELFPALQTRAREHAGNLSGGEQQMLALGQAFLARPRLLMIDELSLGLAPAIVEQLVRTVRRINEGGTTVVLVEQSVNVALTVAERAVFMEKGEIRFDGRVADLMRRPDLVRAVFMGGALGGAPVRSASGRKVGAAAEREPVLRAEGLVVRFGGVEALRGAGADAVPGEVVGIIGPNGAGKSTLFDAIAGHVQPVAGTVMLGGADVTSLSPDARGRAGLVRSFQNARLFGSLTVRECIAVAMERHVRVRGALNAIAFAPPVRKQERRIRRRV